MDFANERINTAYNQVRSQLAIILVTYSSLLRRMMMEEKANLKEAQDTPDSILRLLTFDDDAKDGSLIMRQSFRDA
jgi:hypothetical protein